jgi:hypothetical protein
LLEQAMALMKITTGVREDKTGKSVSAPLFLLGVSTAPRMLDINEASTLRHSLR